MYRILQLLFVAIASAVISRLVEWFMPIDLPIYLIVLVFALAGFVVTGRLQSVQVTNFVRGATPFHSVSRREEDLKAFSVTAFTRSCFGWSSVGLH